MAKKRISDLPAAGPITGSEVVPVVQDGASKKAALSDIVTTLAPAPDLSGKQDVNAKLTAISGLTAAADKLIYWTGATTAALTDLTAFGRQLIATADSAAARALLGVKTMLFPTTITAPTIAGSTLLGSTGAVTQRADTTRGFYLGVQGTGTAADRCLLNYRSVAGTAWTYTVLLNSAMPLGNYRMFGIGTRDSASGNMMAFGNGGSGDRALRITRWSDISTYVGEQYSPLGRPQHGAFWLRLNRASSTFTLSASADGETWDVLWVGTPTYTTIDQVGVWLGVNDSAFSGAANQYHYVHVMSETLV